MDWANGGVGGGAAGAVRVADEDDLRPARVALRVHEVLPVAAGVPALQQGHRLRDAHLDRVRPGHGQAGRAVHAVERLQPGGAEEVGIVLGAGVEVVLVGDEQHVEALRCRPPPHAGRAGRAVHAGQDHHQLALQARRTRVQHRGLGQVAIAGGGIGLARLEAEAVQGRVATIDVGTGAWRRRRRRGGVAAATGGVRRRAHLGLARSSSGIGGRRDLAAAASPRLAAAAAASPRLAAAAAASPQAAAGGRRAGTAAAGARRRTAAAATARSRRSGIGRRAGQHQQ